MSGSIGSILASSDPSACVEVWKGFPLLDSTVESFSGDAISICASAGMGGSGAGSGVLGTTSDTGRITMGGVAGSAAVTGIGVSFACKG